jgi:hypothetical protein
MNLITLMKEGIWTARFFYFGHFEWTLLLQLCNVLLLTNPFLSTCMTVPSTPGVDCFWDVRGLHDATMIPYPTVPYHLP